jgi:hypothetical protein
VRDWIPLRDVVLSTECDDRPSGDDLQPRADITSESGDPVQTTTKVGHVE